MEPIKNPTIKQRWETMYTCYKDRPLQLAWHSFLFGLGFLLSPLSWWNDIFINMPLAWGGAWVIGKLLDVASTVTGSLFIGLFVCCYWVSNAVGLLLMKYVYDQTCAPAPKKQWVSSLVVGILYSLIAVLLAWNNILDSIPFYPPWVIR